MPIELCDYENGFKEAIKSFWRSREESSRKQVEAGRMDQGSRSMVTSGKNMNGFVDFIRRVVVANGLPAESIFFKERLVTLPGFFRPTKLWDVLVKHDGRLVAVLEFKSQVGSFGNNFNNRSEEAIGSALDFWTAFREGAFGESPRPFLGWVMLCEDAPGSRKPTGVLEPHFKVFPEFQDAGYADRYNVLCRKLIAESLYTGACILLSPRNAIETGEYTELSELTGARAFIAELAARVAAESVR